MAVTNLALQATSKNSIMVFNSPILATPIIIQATGIEDMLMIEDIEAAEMQVGTDGVLTSFVKPSFVKGTLTLQPLSTALQSFRTIQKTQYETGISIYNTLAISNPAGVWEVVYSNVLITTAFKGFELANKVKDVPIKFSAQIPDSTVLGDIISVAIGVANLI